MNGFKIFGVALIIGILVALLVPAFLSQHPTNAHGQVITQTEREVLDHLISLEARLKRLEEKLDKR